MSTYFDGPPDEWGVPVATEPRPAVNEAQAKRLRDAWVQAVRRHHERRTGYPSSYNSSVVWDGGVHRVNKKHYQPVWPQLVARARQLDVDPFELVESLFETAVSDNVPTPREIFSPANVARVRRRRTAYEETLASRLRSDEANFMAAEWAARVANPDPAAAGRFALNDMRRPISAAFRYSAARLRRYADVAERWRAQALAEVAYCPGGYLKYWSHVLPDDLKAAAAAALK